MNQLCGTVVYLIKWRSLQTFIENFVPSSTTAIITSDNFHIALHGKCHCVQLTANTHANFGNVCELAKFYLLILTS